MNILLLKEKLLKLGEKIGLQVQEEKKDSLIVHSTIVAKEYFANPFYCRLIVYDSGTLHLFLTFDETDKTTDKLFLINGFNETNPWFKAYITDINDKNYLELHYASYGLINESEVLSTFGFLLSALIEQPTLDYLKVLLEDE